MFARFVFEKLSAEYSDKIILIDTDNLESKTHYCDYFAAQGFQIIRYENDLRFRAEHDDAISSSGKYAVIVAGNVYIPYDVRRRFRLFTVSIAELFPKLNTSTLREWKCLNYDLLAMAYRKNFNDLKIRQLTEQFLQSKVYGKKNIEEYLRTQVDLMNSSVSGAKTYKDWFAIGNLKAEIDTMATEYDIPVETDYIHDAFIEWVLAEYGKLSSKIDRETPVLVSRAMEYMHERSDKFAIIVMDGMSEFDWRILSTAFERMVYHKADAFAMIPTVTSISRQCLLSNKYPSQLVEPWKQSKEKAEFTDCALSMGFTAPQIGYERGYEAEFSAIVKCAAVIINEIDDTVHGQGQGRLGMFNDVRVMAKQDKLGKLVRRLLRQGFDVYISADHGNTPCVGDGKLMGTGVETETKSRRMLVLKDFADKQTIIDRYGMIEYPKYYLTKKYDYLICPAGHSLDAKGEEVMSHGGITVDECIVPFITIKAGENNG